MNKELSGRGKLQLQVPFVMKTGSFSIGWPFFHDVMGGWGVFSVKII